jgi:membrane-associated phospholipid phosphatase
VPIAGVGLEMQIAGSTVVSIERPPRTTFTGEIAAVLAFAQLRDDRTAEILTQIDSQLAFWASIVQIRPDLTPKTYELLNVALQLAIFVEMRFKSDLGCWRPVNFSADVQPMITTPGHGTLPMGHASQAYMSAYILWKLQDPNGLNTGLRDMLYRQAFRMAFNRIVAGVHFPVDLPAGAILGLALGEYFVRRCTPLDPCNKWSGTPGANAPLDTWLFNTAKYTANPITKADFTAGYNTGKTSALGFPLAPTTSYLWSLASKEWDGRRLEAAASGGGGSSAA